MGAIRVTPHHVTYTVKPEQAARNEQLIRDVFAELAEVQPAGVRYEVFKLQDGVSFIHLINVDGEDGKNPLAKLPSLRAFHAGIRERCETAPIRTKLTQLGSYQPTS
jgi:hypothetical protein